MKTALTVIAIVVLSGCTNVTYTDKEGRSVKSSSFLTDRGPTKIVYVDGDKKAEVEIGQRTQLEALSKIKELVDSVK